ncbi:MAG: hypothetical protein SWK76_07570 [Actinomycetota bacterium]|nr:hypothetical protein [Actinomycetota bacterium]
MLSVAGQLAAGKIKFYEVIGGGIFHITLALFGIWVLAIAAH